MRTKRTLQVGVKILLKNDEGKYLILRRSKEKYPEVTDVWDIPGGRINPGESLLKNLKREVNEETGLEIKGIPSLLAAQDILKIPGRHVIRLTYVGLAKGQVRLDPDENEDYQWLRCAELMKLSRLDRYLRIVLRDMKKL